MIEFRPVLASISVIAGYTNDDISGDTSRVGMEIWPDCEGGPVSSPALIGPPKIDLVRSSSALLKLTWPSNP